MTATSVAPVAGGMAAFTLAMVLALMLPCVANAAFPIPKAHPFIVHVSAENFRQEVIDPTIPVVVQFYLPKDKTSKSFSDEYERAAQALQGFCTFKVMDASKEDGAGVAQMFGIQSFPAVVLFNPEMLPVAGGQEGQYMKLPVGFAGKRTADAVVEWVLASIDGHQIDRIEDEVDLQDFLLKFAAFELPKIILFQKHSNVTSPAFKVMSHVHRYGALFAVVPPTASPAVAEKYALTQLPAVISVAAGDETDVLKDAENADLQALDKFIARVALTKEKKMQMQAVILEEEQKLRKKEAEEAKMNKALPVVIATSEEEWQQHCTKLKKGTCVAVFLDGLGNAPLEMLNNCSRKLAPRTSAPVQFVVVDGLHNYKITQFFELTDGLPGIVYITPGKKAFQNHVGSFQERSIINFFVDKVGKGRSKRYDPKAVPAFAVTPAEEKDGEAGGSDELGDELTDEM